MIQDILRQLSLLRSACKLGSIALAVTVLIVGALERLNTPTLLWVAAPLVFLGLADAGYAARHRYLGEMLKTGKGSEQPEAFSEGPMLASLIRFCVSLGAFSVWPFYLVLWGIVVAAAFDLPRQTASSTPGELPGVRSVGPPAYPPAMIQRPPNAAPYTAPLPGVPPRTPWPGFPRPGTPPGVGLKPPIRTPGTVPTVNYGAPPPFLGTPVPPISPKP